MPKGRGVLSHLPWGRGAKGVFSFQREYPLWNPQRKAMGVPLDPDIAGLELEELHALRNSG